MKVQINTELLEISYDQLAEKEDSLKEEHERNLQAFEKKATKKINQIRHACDIDVEEYVLHKGI